MNKNIIKFGIFSLLTISIIGCDSITDLDEDLNSPNNPTVAEGDLNLYLNRVQLGVQAAFDDFSTLGMELTRMTPLASASYGETYTGSNFDTTGAWRRSYEDILVETNNIVTLAEERGWYNHAGMAQVLQAYTLMTLVDYFGNVPFSESFDPTNTNPTRDEGSAVYTNDVIGTLDKAIANFELDSAVTPDTDLYYDNDINKWIVLANTLKLKAYLQTRLVDTNAKTEIDALIASGNLMSSSVDDFQFDYSTSDVPTDSRHPFYTLDYTSNIQTYMANYFMNTVIFEKDLGLGNQDPRTRYYFYRQNDVVEVGGTSGVSCNPDDKPAHYSADTPYCTLTNGYWGRDMGDGDGIPSDTDLRTVWGIYPVGGAFDADSYDTRTSVSDIKKVSGTLEGQGIAPFMLYAYTKFMLAESALMLGTSGDPKSLLEEGIRESISKVMDFSSSALPLATVLVEDDPDTTEDETVTWADRFVPTTEEIDNYVTFVLNEYDGAASNDDKLNIIIREYYIAAFGNGVEVYNNYRRTGMPKNIQPMLSSNPGTYPRSMQYPLSSTTNNNNSSPKTSVAEQVFWDTNAAGFIE